MKREVICMSVFVGRVQFTNDYSPVTCECWEYDSFVAAVGFAHLRSIDVCADPADTDVV